MSHSLKIPVTGVPKSDNPVLGKGRRVHFSNTVKTKEKQQNKDVSAHVIQRAWLSHLDKTVFQLLKHTICAAEHHVTHEILKKVSPLEAELVKDPCMKCKVRFRFSGEIFPPFIVFKIFLHTEGHGYKYFSGKKFLKPSSECLCLLAKKKIFGMKNLYKDLENTHQFSLYKNFGLLIMNYSDLLVRNPACATFILCRILEKEKRLLLYVFSGNIRENLAWLQKCSIRTSALVSCIQPGLAICFTLDNIHVSMLFSQIIPPSPSPIESKSLFYTSGSLFSTPSPAFIACRLLDSSHSDWRVMVPH
ncbi:hypothetical protein FD754_022155 [Muntiacus muntjak]|uniref:Uncharacterized protein n=1 Tax=Muntiacus muntjak TaxID=9888 RepID=A0A5N3V824_MUNMU|nr:hypothetical protein FD754_022155 [Muntiacus muntjak]